MIMPSNIHLNIVAKGTTQHFQTLMSSCRSGQFISSLLLRALCKNIKDF